jgi:hypothetical protein
LLSEEIFVFRCWTPSSGMSIVQIARTQKPTTFSLKFLRGTRVSPLILISMNCPGWRSIHGQCYTQWHPWSHRLSGSHFSFPQPTLETRTKLRPRHSWTLHLAASRSEMAKMISGHDHNVYTVGLCVEQHNYNSRRVCFGRWKSIFPIEFPNKLSKEALAQSESKKPMNLNPGQLLMHPYHLFPGAWAAFILSLFYITLLVSHSTSTTALDYLARRCLTYTVIREYGALHLDTA